MVNLVLHQATFKVGELRLALFGLGRTERLVEPDGLVPQLQFPGTLNQGVDIRNREAPFQRELLFGENLCVELFGQFYNLGINKDLKLVVVDQGDKQPQRSPDLRGRETDSLDAGLLQSLMHPVDESNEPSVDALNRSGLLA